MSQHTPGPWEWVGTAEGWYKVGGVEAADGSTVMHFGDDEAYYPTEGQPPGNADRHLILAAPDLLAACERMLADLKERQETKMCSRASWEQEADLRAAIAKAKGEAS